MHEHTAPAGWDAQMLAGRAGWTLDLRPDLVNELARAGQEILASGRKFRDIGSDDLILPRLREALTLPAQILEHGTGVALLRGFPVERYSGSQIRAQFWALGTCLGVGVSQNRRGDYLGDVIDLSDQQDSARPFQRGGELLMHRDPVDLVGLMCIRHAKSGGLSRIASATMIHDIIERERPHLLAQLYAGYFYHRISEDRGKTAELTPYRVPVFARTASGALSCFFIRAPIERAAERGVGIGPLEREAIDYLVSVSRRPGVYYDMNLAAGDIQFLSNRLVLHSRTDYEDHEDVRCRRFMLRLWLMAPHWEPVPANQRFFDEEDRCGGGLPFQEREERQLASP